MSKPAASSPTSSCKSKTAVFAPSVKQGEIPASASVVDWSRYTVLPGLIDLHTHLIGDVQGSNIAAPLLSSGARDALMGAGHARETLLAGFSNRA